MRHVTVPDPAPGPGAAGGWTRLVAAAAAQERRSTPAAGCRRSLLPPASGSRAGRPATAGTGARRPSPSRPPTRSRPRRRGVASGACPRAAPRSRRWRRCQTATFGISPRWRRSASASRGRTALPGQRRCGWCRRATRSSCGRSAAGAAAGIGGCVPTPTARSATQLHTHPVRARPVEGAGTVEAVTGAYAAKYGDSPYVGPLLTEEAADATLRLEPRP